MKDLFICYAGRKRSKWAVEIARELAGKNGISNYVAENAGIVDITNTNKEEVSDEYMKIFGLKKRTTPLEGYDRIFVMEEEFKRELIKKGIPSEKIYVLNVTGELQRAEQDVRGELERKLKEFF